MRLIDADAIYPWYMDAFDFDPNEVRFSMNDIRDNLDNIPTHPTPSNTNVPDTNVGELISRQEAIKAILGEPPEVNYPIYYAEKIKGLPSVQPTTLTEDDKETIRIHLSAFKERLCNQRRWNEAEEYVELISRLLSTPSVQPRGKWIKDNPHSEIYRYACSECHAHHRARYDFCPSCGCRMEEGDSE